MATYGAASISGRRVLNDDIFTVVDKSAKSQAEKALRAAERTARRRAGRSSVKQAIREERENATASYEQRRAAQAKPSAAPGPGGDPKMNAAYHDWRRAQDVRTAAMRAEPGSQPKSNRNRNIALAATGTAAVGGGAYALSRRGRKTEASKGLGVMPTLARRAPAAGRGGRRMVTGDVVNRRRVIGKNEVSKLSFGAFKTGWGQGLAGASKPKLPLAQVGQVKSGIAGQRLGQGALWAKNNKRLAGGVLGTTALAGAGVNSAFGKRRFDPEDERRHRQGQLSGLAAASGAASLGNAGRLAARDTKDFHSGSKSVRDRIPATAADEFRPREPRIPRRERGESNVNLAHRHALDYGKHREKSRRFDLLESSLKSTEKVKGRKLVAVGGRSAAYGTAGIALIGTAAGLHRNRKEERWD